MEVTTPAASCTKGCQDGGGGGAHDTNNNSSNHHDGVGPGGTLFAGRHQKRRQCQCSPHGIGKVYSAERNDARRVVLAVVQEIITVRARKYEVYYCTVLPVHSIPVPGSCVSGCHCQGWLVLPVTSSFVGAGTAPSPPFTNMHTRSLTLFSHRDCVALSLSHSNTLTRTRTHSHTHSHSHTRSLTS